MILPNLQEEEEVTSQYRARNDIAVFRLRPGQMKEGKVAVFFNME